jgi:hypothetical protein
MKKEQNIWIPFAGFIFLVISVVFFWIALPNLTAKTPAPTASYSETIHKVEAVEEPLDFKTPALYFFSTIAQTMGALLAISFAILSLSKKPSDFSKPYQYEPYRRIIFNDPHLKTFIQFSAISTVTSIISLIVLYLAGSWNLLAFFLIPVGIFVMVIATVAICNIYHFIRYKYQIMSGTAMILRQFRNELENKKTHKDTIIDYFELSIMDLHNAKSILKEDCIHTLVNKHLVSYPDLKTLFLRLYNDISIHNSYQKTEKTIERLFYSIFDDKILYHTTHSQQDYSITNFDKLFVDFCKKARDHKEANNAISVSIFQRLEKWFIDEKSKAIPFIIVLTRYSFEEMPYLHSAMHESYVSNNYLLEPNIFNSLSDKTKIEVIKLFACILSYGISNAWTHHNKAQDNASIYLSGLSTLLENLHKALANIHKVPEFIIHYIESWKEKQSTWLDGEIMPLLKYILLENRDYKFHPDIEKIGRYLRDYKKPTQSEE